MSTGRKLHWEVTHRSGVAHRVADSHRSACGAWGSLYFAPSPDRINCRRCRASIEHGVAEQVPSADVMRHIRQENTGHGRPPS